MQPHTLINPSRKCWYLFSKSTFIFTCHSFLPISSRQSCSWNQLPQLVQQSLSAMGACFDPTLWIPFSTVVSYINMYCSQIYSVNTLHLIAHLSKSIHELTAEFPDLLKCDKWRGCLFWKALDNVYTNRFFWVVGDN